DADGNRTIGSYQTGTGNRLSTDGTFNYSYDGEGNLQTKQLVSDPTKLATFTWDHRDRLTRVQSNIGGSLDEQFTYDAFDRRTSKSTSTQASRFVSLILPISPRRTSFIGNLPILALDIKRAFDTLVLVSCFRHLFLWGGSSHASPR